MMARDGRGTGRLPEAALLAGAALAVLAMGAVLVWFLVFSGLTEPVQFVYGSF